MKQWWGACSITGRYFNSPEKGALAWDLTVIIGAVYRPPGEHVKVLEELKASTASTMSQNTKLVLCSDFNLPGIGWNTFSATNNDVVSGEELNDN